MQPGNPQGWDSSRMVVLNIRDDLNGRPEPEEHAVVFVGFDDKGVAFAWPARLHPGLPEIHPR